MNTNIIRRRLETAMFDRASVYPLTWKQVSGGTLYAYFMTQDGRKGVIEFQPTINSWKAGIVGISITATFSIDHSIAVTGGGDALRIFSTVLFAIRDLVRKRFERAFPDRVLDGIILSAEDAQGESRVKLYKRMAKRFAPRIGFDFRTQVYPGGMGFIFKPSL